MHESRILLYFVLLLERGTEFSAGDCGGQLIQRSPIKTKQRKVTKALKWHPDLTITKPW